MNMGTPGHPEGLKHWTVKSMMAHKLRVALESSPRTYGALFAGDLRNVQLPTGINPSVASAINRVGDRVSPREWQSYAAFPEPAHDSCSGGLALVNILDGLRGGRVTEEEPFAGYIPDIALYAQDADTPTCIIEVVATSEPSPAKVAVMASRGVTVYRLDASKDPQLIFNEPVVEMKILTSSPCQDSLRAEVERFFVEWSTEPSPFIGIRNYPSGTQEYITGQAKDDDVSWSIGDPEVLGIARNDSTAWREVPMVSPSRTKSIAKGTWAFILVWMRCALWQESYLPDTTPLQRRVARTFMGYIDDLLSMVRDPTAKTG